MTKAEPHGQTPFPPPPPFYAASRSVAGASRGWPVLPGGLGPRGPGMAAAPAGRNGGERAGGERRDRAGIAIHVTGERQGMARDRRCGLALGHELFPRSPFPIPSQACSQSPYGGDQPRPAPVTPAVTQNTGPHCCSRPRPFLRRLPNGRAGRGLNGGGGPGPLVPPWAALRAQVGLGPAGLRARLAGARPCGGLWWGGSRSRSSSRPGAHRAGGGQPESFLLPHHPPAARIVCTIFLISLKLSFSCVMAF